MSIYIPFKSYGRSIGGPATFMRNLKNFLDKSGYCYSERLNRNCSIFFPISYKIKLLEKVKNGGGHILQRLDGIYYPEKHGADYIDKNALIKEIYLNFTDFVVFQSDYSRKQCFELFGEVRQYAIIINGVDTSIFYPNQGRVFSKTDSMAFCTTGNFRNRDMLEPIICAFDELTDAFHFTFNVIGPVAPELKHLLDRPYIRHKDKLDLYGVADELRNSDVFLYSHLNPPCPNSVIEAVASGMPVVGFDSGSMRELLHFNTELLAYVSEDTFQAYSQFNYERLKEKIQKVHSEFVDHKKVALSNCSSYAFEKSGTKYVEVFDKFEAESTKSDLTKMTLLQKIKQFILP